MRSPEQIIKRPLLTEKGTRLKDTGGHGDGDVDPETLKSQLLFEVATRRQQGRDSPRRSEAVERRRRRRPHVDRARQGEAHRPLHRQAIELEEGHRDHRGWPDHRVLRGSVSAMGLRPHNATTPGSRGRVGARLLRAVTGKQAREVAHRVDEPAPAAATTTVASRRASAAAATSAATASSTSRRNKLGVPAKVATIEYDPNRTARIALLHYADGEKRYILCPDGLKVGDTVLSSRNADIKPGNTLPLRIIPVGTMIHNIELKIRAARRCAAPPGLGAQLMAKEGDYGPGPPALGRDPQGPPRLPRDHRSGRQHRARQRPRRQGRAHALAGPPPAQPRRHHEPGRPPARRRRRPIVGRPPPVLAVGPADQGPQDAQEQAHRRVHHQAPRQEGSKGNRHGSFNQERPLRRRPPARRRWWRSAPKSKKVHQDLVAPLDHHPRVRRAARSRCTTAASSSPCS